MTSPKVIAAQTVKSRGNDSPGLFELPVERRIVDARDVPDSRPIQRVGLEKPTEGGHGSIGQGVRVHPVLDTLTLDPVRGVLRQVRD